MKPAANPLPALVTGLFVTFQAGAAAAQDDLRGRLGGLLDDWRIERNITGVAMAVAGPGISVIELASGTAVAAENTAMTPDRRLLISSVTKTFVAATVLQLVDDGALALDDPLGRWLPGVPSASEITIRQLLSHTNGLPDYLTPEIRTGFAETAIERHATASPGFTPQELLGLANTLAPAFEPGTSFTHSNTNYVLLGRIIELETGAPLHAALREGLFEPLGLDSFHLAGAEPAPSPWGPGYATEYAGLFGAEGPALVDQRMAMLVASTAWASGALVGTAGDVARFQRALMEGAVLEASTLAEMVAPSPVVDGFVASIGAPDIGGGLGVFLYPFPDPIGIGVGHDGGEPGFRSLTLTFPDHRISVAVLVNDGRPDFGIFPRGRDVDDLLGEAVRLTMEVTTGAHASPRGGFQPGQD